MSANHSARLRPSLPLSHQGSRPPAGQRLETASPSRSRAPAHCAEAGGPAVAFVAAPVCWGRVGHESSTSRPPQG